MAQIGAPINTITFSLYTIVRISSFLQCQKNSRTINHNDNYHKTRKHENNFLPEWKQQNHFFQTNQNSDFFLLERLISDIACWASEKI